MPSSKSPFGNCEAPLTIIQRLLRSSKPHIVEGIASSVRSQRAGSRRRRSRRSQAITPFRLYGTAIAIYLSDWSDATKRLRGCEAGARRCVEESVRSYLLQEKQASAKPLWSTPSRGTSLLTGAYE